jgi:hypothetical protein
MRSVVRGSGFSEARRESHIRTQTRRMKSYGSRTCGLESPSNLESLHSMSRWDRRHSRSLRRSERERRAFGRATSRLTLRVLQASTIACKARDANGDSRRGARRILFERGVSGSPQHWFAEPFNTTDTFIASIWGALSDALCALRTVGLGLRLTQFVPSEHFVPSWPPDVRPWRPPV